MSIQSNAGSGAAASEILALVRQKIEENKDKPDVVTALHEIEKKAEEIKEASDSGWY